MRQFTFGDGSSQCSLAMVYMSNGSNVHMGLVSGENLLCVSSKTPL